MCRQFPPFKTQAASSSIRLEKGGKDLDRPVSRVSLHGNAWMITASARCSKDKQVLGYLKIYTGKSCVQEEISLQCLCCLDSYLEAIDST